MPPNQKKNIEDAEPEQIISEPEAEPEIKTEEDKPAHKKKRGFMEKMKEAFDE